MGPFVGAWLLAEGIIVYRSVKVHKAPPSPGALLLSSGLFVALGLLAESPKARPLATAFAWGFDIAALMNLWGTGGPKTTSDAGTHWPPPKASNGTIFPVSGSTGQLPSAISTPNTNIQQV